MSTTALIFDPPIPPPFLIPDSVDLKARFNAGSHFTHLLDIEGELVELKAQTSAALLQLLASMGFPEPEPRVCHRSALKEERELANKERIEAAKPLDSDYRAFKKKSLGLEDFTDSMIAFLETGNETQQILEFLAVNAELIENGRFRPMRGKFSAFLKREFKEFLVNARPTATPARLIEKEDDDQDELEAEDSDDSEPGTKKEKQKKPYEAVKKTATKKKVNAAYIDFLQNPEAGEIPQQNLITILFGLSRSKLSGTLYGKKEVFKTLDDYAQDLTIKLMKKIPQFNGKPESFYAWAHKIVFNARIDAVNEVNDYVARHVGLEIEMEDGTHVDNPEIYGNEPPPRYRRKLPDWIQGDDLLICNLIRVGNDYAEIAETMDLNKYQVQRAVIKMRNRIKKEKDAKNKLIK